MKLQRFGHRVDHSLLRMYMGAKLRRQRANDRPNEMRRRPTVLAFPALDDFAAVGLTPRFSNTEAQQMNKPVPIMLPGIFSSTHAGFAEECVSRFFPMSGAGQLFQGGSNPTLQLHAIEAYSFCQMASVFLATVFRAFQDRVYCRSMLSLDCLRLPPSTQDGSQIANILSPALQPSDTKQKSRRA